MTTEHAVDATLRLASGRTLGWATYGDRGGVPVVACHGSPDSRRIWALIDGSARTEGIRLICPDRPGFGLSDPVPGRTVLDWPADVAAVLDHLGVDRFVAAGLSGGGAYACATAWALPERVQGLGLCSVIGPLDRPRALNGMNRQVRLTYVLARRAPRLLRPVLAGVARAAAKDPEKAADRLFRTRPPEDRTVLARPEVRAALLANLPEQFRDVDSILHERRLAVAPWGFPLGEITPPTHVWQGGRDDVHTPAMAQQLAAEIPGAALTVEPSYATFDFFDDVGRLLRTFRRWATSPD